MLLNFLKKLFGYSPRTTRSEFRTLIDWNAFDTMLERSPVPAILVMVLVWAVSTTALLLSTQHQNDPLEWKIGEKAPYTILARCDFSSVDREATERAEGKAESDTPEVWCIDLRRSQEIIRNFRNFAEYVKMRLDDRKAKRPHNTVQDSLPAQVAEDIPLSLCEAIAREQERGTTYAAFYRQLEKKVHFGIHQRRKGEKEEKQKVKVIDGSKRERERLYGSDEFPSPRGTAELLANTLFPDDETCNAQFAKAALKLIGEGNLDRSDELSDSAQEKAKKEVKAVTIPKKKGDLLIAKGATLTPAIKEVIKAEMEEAEQKKIPRYDPRAMVTMIVWSFLLLVAAIALQYWLNPRCLGDNRSIIVIGLTVIIAVVLNYQSILFFEHLREMNKLRFADFSIAVVPVALAPAMVAVMLDRRTAIGVGIYVASITAMMIMPDRSFELTLRWCAVTTATALLVGRVNNYRAFFLYTLCVSIVMTSLISLGLGSGSEPVSTVIGETAVVEKAPVADKTTVANKTAVSGKAAPGSKTTGNKATVGSKTTVADKTAVGSKAAPGSKTAVVGKTVVVGKGATEKAGFFDKVVARAAVVGDAAKVILGSGFATAVLSLTLIFLFEVIGNQPTSMSMMVLCDCNHPLLERMKREAPGTMAHSMAVATLSEDAARAIGANALTAKAGALFHDIGKLVMPQYFTENNPDSALQHLNLNPQMSSIIIRDHVKEGLQLARRYRLCREVRDIIGTHHGDDLVRYFYNKMLENAKHEGAATPPVLESQFRYNGEPPRGIEATIVSLADACEAASRSLEHPTPERIRELVDRIILGRFQGGQLRRSRLPLADLEKIRDSFVATLSSSRHGRISYDTPAQAEEREPKNETALPVAEPAAPESRQK